MDLMRWAMQTYGDFEVVPQAFCGSCTFEDISSPDCGYEDVSTGIFRWESVQAGSGQGHNTRKRLPDVVHGQKRVGRFLLL